MALTAEQIRARIKNGPVLHVVTLKSWDGEKVVLQELDGLQIANWDAENLERSKDNRLLSKSTPTEHLVRLCLVSCEFDEQGEPIRGTQKRVFEDTTPDCREVRKLGAALQELNFHCARINMLRRIDEETVEKNSSPVPSSDSGASSPTSGDAA
jgi:hypothetical protein